MTLIAWLMVALAMGGHLLVFQQLDALAAEVRALRRDVRGEGDDVEGALQARLAEAMVREQELREQVSAHLGAIASLRVQLQMERAARDQQTTQGKQ